VESSPLRLSKCRELRILPSARNAKIASDGYAAVTRSTDGFFERFLPIGSREHDRQWGPLRQKNPVRLHNEAASSEVARLSIFPQSDRFRRRASAFSITSDESRTTNATWALTARSDALIEPQAPARLRCRRLRWARYLLCLRGSPRRYAVFAVLTGALRRCRLSWIGHGSVVEPGHAHVAPVLIADDNEVARLTELHDSSFRALSESIECPSGF
jgi:hypothetical protein